MNRQSWGNRFVQSRSIFSNSSLICSFKTWFICLNRLFKLNNCWLLKSFFYTWYWIRNKQIFRFFWATERDLESFFLRFLIIRRLVWRSSKRIRKYILLSFDWLLSWQTSERSPFLRINRCLL